MKKTHSANSKSSLCAVAYFVMMTMVVSFAAKAQNDTVNPLISTTGPNVLDAGKLQLNGEMTWFHYYNYFNHADELGAGAGLRWGIGNRAELTFGVKHEIFNMVGSDTITDSYRTTPSLGARLMLYEGNKVLPTITFQTGVALPIGRNVNWGRFDDTHLQPSMVIQFRNRIGRRWMIDYAFGIEWYTPQFSTHMYGDFLYSVAARWVASDRLMLGIVVADRYLNSGCGLEVLYQATPTLQLGAKANFSGIFDGFSAPVNNFNATVGINWMLK